MARSFRRTPLARARPTLVVTLTALAAVAGPLLAAGSLAPTPIIGRTDAMTTGRIIAHSDTLATGRIVERVVSRFDATKEYALYLPSAFDQTRTWPVLFLLDPRGAALTPMRLYEEVAERYGYLVLSAYGSLSDGPFEPTQRALEAMLQDAQQRFAADTRRLYLVGFSGTVRASWVLAQRLRGHVAGIIGYGATLPNPIQTVEIASLSEPPFSFFVGSGFVDFNYEEMRELRATLEPLGIPSQIRHWEGGHGWGPATIATASVEWMEAHAMKAGLIDVRPDWLEAQYVAGLDEAAALVDEDRRLEARERYHALAETFEDLLDLTVLETRLGQLEGSADYRTAVERAGDQARRHQELVDRLHELVLDAWQDPDPPDVERTIERLEIEGLLATSEGSDPAAAAAAQRVLESYMAEFSFYAPRAWTDVGMSGHAQAALDVAERISPQRGGRFCYRRAVARLPGRGPVIRGVQAARRSKAQIETTTYAHGGLRMDVPEDRYRELGELIGSDASPVGIDAKKTHIIILHMLEDLSERMARIEERLGTSTP